MKLKPFNIGLVLGVLFIALVIGFSFSIYQVSILRNVVITNDYVGFTGIIFSILGMIFMSGIAAGVEFGKASRQDENINQDSTDVKDA